MNSKAWPIEEIARVLLGDKPNNKAVAMLVGYFDESGTSANQGVGLYAGMIADSLLWSRIEVRWRKKLAEYGLSQYHAVDCENRQGEFAHLNRGVRDSLTNFFSKLVAEVSGQIIGQTVVHKDWQHIVPSHIKAHFGNDPLYLSAVVSMQVVSMWSENYVGGEPVAMVFADHQKHSAVLAQIHAELSQHPDWPGLGSITFMQPERAIPLQAADLICYELRRFLTHPAEERQARLNLENGPGEIADAVGRYSPERLALLVKHLEKIHGSQ